MPGRQDRRSSTGFQHALDRLDGRRSAPHPDAWRKSSCTPQATPRTPGKPGRLRAIAAPGQPDHPGVSSSRPAAARTTRPRALQLDVMPESLHQRVPLDSGIPATKSNASSATTPSMPAGRIIRSPRRSSTSVRCSDPRRGSERKRDMSIKHPIIAVTGSSGAGTTTVMKSFAHIFRREAIKAQVIEGDSFHHATTGSTCASACAWPTSGASAPISHFGPRGRTCWMSFRRHLGGIRRDRRRQGAPLYYHGTPAKPRKLGGEPGTFHRLASIADERRLICYFTKGCTAATSTATRTSRVTSICSSASSLSSIWSGSKSCTAINIMRGYSQDAVVETILRRMPDYCEFTYAPSSSLHPRQFLSGCRRWILSNPFIAMDVPKAPM